VRLATIKQAVALVRMVTCGKDSPLALVFQPHTSPVPRLHCAIKAPLDLDFVADDKSEQEQTRFRHHSSLSGKSYRLSILLPPLPRRSSDSYRLYKLTPAVYSRRQMSLGGSSTVPPLVPWRNIDCYSLFKLIPGDYSRWQMSLQGRATLLPILPRRKIDCYMLLKLQTDPLLA